MAPGRVASSDWDAAEMGKSLRGRDCVEEVEVGAGDQILELLRSRGQQDPLTCWPQGIRVKGCPCPHPMDRAWFQQT